MSTCFGLDRGPQSVPLTHTIAHLCKKWDPDDKDNLQIKNNNKKTDGQNNALQWVVLLTEDHLDSFDRVLQRLQRSDSETWNGAVNRATNSDSDLFMML